MYRIAAILVLMIGCAVPNHTHLLSNAGPVRQIVTEEQAIQAQMARCSVKIEREDGGSGSGVVVYQGATSALIITCAHVVTDCNSAAAMQTKKDGMRLADAKVIYRDEENDLAILSTDPIWPGVVKMITVQQVNDGKTFLWQKVMSFGYAMGADDPTLTSGYICDGFDYGFMRTSALTYPGNSGGGIFAQVDGYWTLIGITQRVYTRDGVVISHMSLSCRSTVMIKFMNDFVDEMKSASEK